MMSLATLIVLPYLAFVFFGEGFNPFRKPSLPQLRARFRYGRIMGLAVIIGWLCAEAMIHAVHAPVRGSVVTGVVVAIGLSLYFSAGRITSALRR